MLLAVTEIDGLLQFAELRQWGEVSKRRARSVDPPAALDVAEQRHLPIEIVDLLRPVTEPESHAATTSTVGRQIAVAHQRPEHNLHLLCAQPMWLGDHYPVAREKLTGGTPATRRPDEVVSGGSKLSTPVAARLGHGELEELVGHTVVEPVDDLAGHDAVGFGVVGEHLDLHLLVDDLADLLLRAVGKGDAGVVVDAAEEDANLFAQLVDEDGGRTGVAQRSGDLAQRLAHQAGLKTDVTVAHLAFDLGT